MQPELERLAQRPEYAAYNVNTKRTLQRAGDIVHRNWKDPQAAKAFLTGGK